MTKKEFMKQTNAFLKKGEKLIFFEMENNCLLRNYNETINLEKPQYFYTCSIPFNKKSKRIGLIFNSNDYNRTLSFWRDILNLLVQDIKRTVKYAE